MNYNRIESDGSCDGCCFFKEDIETCSNTIGLCTDHLGNDYIFKEDEQEDRSDALIQ